ncbi:unnamed protein product [Lampetra fluviatilis]
MESAGILLAGGDEERDSCGSRWTELDCDAKFSFTKATPDLRPALVRLDRAVPLLTSVAQPTPVGASVASRAALGQLPLSFPNRCRAPPSEAARAPLADDPRAADRAASLPNALSVPTACRRAPPAPRRTDAAAPPGRYPIIGRRRGSPPKLKSPERESGRVATRGHQTMQGGPGLAVRPARKKPSRHQIQAFLLCARGPGLTDERTPLITARSDRFPNAAPPGTARSGPVHYGSRLPGRGFFPTIGEKKNGTEEEEERRRRPSRETGERRTSFSCNGQKTASVQVPEEDFEISQDRSSFCKTRARSWENQDSHVGLRAHVCTFLRFGPMAMRVPFAERPLEEEEEEATWLEAPARLSWHRWENLG